MLYNTYMGLWSDVFGEKHCVVRVYESISGDIVSDFLQSVLGINDIDSFSRARSKANERVSRDLLEFKRTINRSVRFAERDIERAILRRIDEEMDWRRTEPDCYQDFLSPDERAELLSRLRPELEALQASHDVPPFPPFDLDRAKANWRPYPGLGSAPEARDRVPLRSDQQAPRVSVGASRSEIRWLPSEEAFLGQESCLTS